MKPSKRATAYHEAGHAIIAVLDRRRFKRVSIVAGVDSLGHVLLKAHPCSFKPEIDSDRKTRNYIEREITRLLAGSIAEKIATGRANHRGAESDYDKAVNLASYSCGSDKECEKFIEWLWVRTENRLKTRLVWNAVKAVALALLERNELSARETRAIVKEACRPPRTNG